MFWPKKLPKLKYLAQNLATWATFPEVLLHKNLKIFIFSTGTNSGTKNQARN